VALDNTLLGHARSPADLFRIVTEIDAANVLFPMHTPSAPKCTSGRQKKMAAVVEEGETYTL
jgi:hypothetical protein